MGITMRWILAALVFLTPFTARAVTAPFMGHAPGAIVTVGEMQTYTVGEEDTLLDIAEKFNLGFVELRAANPLVDPWFPLPGTEVTVPAQHLLPFARQDGIIINLGEMRLYVFEKDGAPPKSYPIGIGREGLSTPMGETTIARKAKNPPWYPTPRMREENPNLPEIVPAGPENPLGDYALYLGWPTFLMHGTNKPWGIGRRVSSGCIRMYPDNIKYLYNTVPAGTPVTVIDQPVKLSWIEEHLYLEAHPSREQADKIEDAGGLPVFDVPDRFMRVVLAQAGPEAERLDWRVIRAALKARNGYPVRITN